jgi:hypothetical protein
MHFTEQELANFLFPTEILNHINPLDNVTNWLFSGGDSVGSSEEE